MPRITFTLTHGISDPSESIVEAKNQARAVQLEPKAFIAHSDIYEWIRENQGLRLWLELQIYYLLVDEEDRIVKFDMIGQSTISHESSENIHELEDVIAINVPAGHKVRLMVNGNHNGPFGSHDRHRKPFKLPKPLNSTCQLEYNLLVIDN